MATTVEKIEKELIKEGFSGAQLDKAMEIVKDNIPSEVYKNAIHYLGATTLLLGFGSLAVYAYKAALPEPIWGLVGAGIGGLAGIFTASK